MFPEDTIGIDLYAKLDEDVKTPVLVYENENSGKMKFPLNLFTMRLPSLTRHISPYLSKRFLTHIIAE